MNDIELEKSLPEDIRTNNTDGSQKITEHKKRYLSLKLARRNMSKMHVAVFAFIFGVLGASLIFITLAAPTTKIRVDKISVAGELSVIAKDDFKLDKDGKPDPDVTKWQHRTEYTLKANGQEYQLDFGSGDPELLSGSKVTVSGQRTGQTIKVDHDEKGLKVDYKALPHHSPRKTAVFLINWADNPITPAPVDKIKHQVFGTTWDNPGFEEPPLNLYYQETSYNERALIGKIDPTGDVFGYYTVATSYQNCNFPAWADEARQQAQAKGIDVSGYDNYIYAWPGSVSTGCAFSGFADVGGSTSYDASIFSFGLNISTAAHELGHNFGVGHANGLKCYDKNGITVAMSDNCQMIEYQDPYDVMGNSSYYQMNAIHKYMLGWLKPSNVQAVTSSGEYTVTPLETAGPEVKMLQVFTPSKGKVYFPNYCLEFRQRSGVIDGRLNAQAIEGIMIRQAFSCTNSLTSNLIDTTPVTNEYSWFDQPLAVGKTFNDPVSGMSITLVSVAPEGAKVSIKLSSSPLNDAQCTINNVPKAVKPGTSFTTSMTIKNTGSTNWKATDYELGALDIVPVPFGTTGQYNQSLSSTWGTASIALIGDVASRGSANLSATLTAPTTLGSYEFDWRTHQKSQDEWFGAPCQSIVVVNDDIDPPTAPSGLILNSKTSSSVVLSWNASTDNKAVAGYKIYRTTTTRSKGKTITNSSLAGYATNTNYTDNGLTAGTSYTYYVVAYDEAKNESLPSNNLLVTF